MIRWLGARGALGLHLALLEDSLRLLRTAARDDGRCFGPSASAMLARSRGMSRCGGHVIVIVPNIPAPGAPCSLQW